MRSFKSNENIHKKKDVSYYVVWHMQCTTATQYMHKRGPTAAQANIWKHPARASNLYCKAVASWQAINTAAPQHWPKLILSPIIIDNAGQVVLNKYPRLTVQQLLSIWSYWKTSREMDELSNAELSEPSHLLLYTQSGLKSKVAVNGKNKWTNENVVNDEGLWKACKSL